MARLAVIPGSRPRRPCARLAEAAVEMQVAVHDAQRASAPLWEAAIQTGNRDLLDRCQTLAVVMRSARAMAREIAGLAEPPDEPMERAA